jgi:cell wall-associated NlpC family hydrolase
MNTNRSLFECIVPVAPLRKEASDKAEIVSQALFGERLVVLEENDKWAIIESTEDQYQGWIDKKQIAESTPSTDLATLSHPVQLVHHKSLGNLWLPAGACVNRALVNNASDIIARDFELSAQAIESVAMQFQNAPYLWGGKTILGIDCSGFTQTVFKLCGFQLKRDAFQQVEQGSMIDFVDEAITGDLAFFDNAEGRITHVGIVLNTADGKRIIHASGKVRIDKLDHQGIFNLDTHTYSHNLRFIKRIMR